LIKHENVVSFLREFILIIGFISFVFGIYLIHLPAALIAGGVLLLIAGYPKKYFSKIKKTGK